MKRIIKSSATILLAAIMAISGCLIGIGLTAVEVHASERQYEPTIFMRRLPRGNTFSQGHTITRDRFLRTYGNPNLFHFEGAMYTSAEFFDRYNGLGFRWELNSNNPQGVQAHDVTLIPGHISAPRRVRDGNAEAVASESTGISTASAPESANQDQYGINNNVPSLQPNPVSEWQEGEAILLDGLTLLTSEELSALAAIAPSAEDTRSAMILTRQRLTDNELAAWIDEYRALGGINAFELEVVRLINIERAEHGLHPLYIVPHYMKAARLRSHSMTDVEYFSHTSPVYGGAGAFIYLFGRNLGASETLSANRQTPEGAVNAWLNSPGHRRILLSETTGAIGVGRVGHVTTALFMGSWALDLL